MQVTQDVTPDYKQGSTLTAHVRYRLDKKAQRQTIRHITQDEPPLAKKKLTQANPTAKAVHPQQKSISKDTPSDQICQTRVTHQQTNTTTGAGNDAQENWRGDQGKSACMMPDIIRSGHAIVLSHNNYSLNTEDPDNAEILVEDKAKLDAIESKLENIDNNLDKKDIKTNTKDTNIDKDGLDI